MFLKKNNERISYFKIKSGRNIVEETLWQINLDSSMFPSIFSAVIPLFIMGILTGVWSPSILSTDILSVHRVICPTTESPSMKYPYLQQPTPPLLGNPVSASDLLYETLFIMDLIGQFILWGGGGGILYAQIIWLAHIHISIQSFSIIWNTTNNVFAVKNKFMKV